MYHVFVQQTKLASPFCKFKSRKKEKGNDLKKKKKNLKNVILLNS
jgi:hypothetical protein